MEIITQSKTVTSNINGTQVVLPDALGIGLDALDQVTVITDVEDEHTLIRGTFKENGTFNAPEGVAYNKVVVDVEGGNLEELTVTENGVYEPDEESEFDGYSKVTVDIPDPYVASKEVTIATNGEIVVEPSKPEGYPAWYLDKVTIKTEVVPILEDRVIQANGSYNCAEGYEGFRTVVVDVQDAPILQEKSVEVTENGSISVLADEDFTGLSKVDITVDVEPTEEEKDAFREEGKEAQLTEDKAAVAAIGTITENGSVDILGESVVVDVPSDPEDLAEAKEEGVVEGKASQLAEDKSAVEALSPITENGVKVVLGESITVNVPDSEEGLAAAKAEGKAEQLVDDKAKVAAVPEITTNGTKAIGDLGNVRVNVSGGGSDDIILWSDGNGEVTIPSYLGGNTAPAVVEEHPFYLKTIKLKDSRNGNNADVKSGAIYVGQYVPFNVDAPGTKSFISKFSGSFLREATAYAGSASSSGLSLDLYNYKSSDTLTIETNLGRTISIQTGENPDIVVNATSKMISPFESNTDKPTVINTAFDIAVRGNITVNSNNAINITAGLDNTTTNLTLHCNVAEGSTLKLMSGKEIGNLYNDNLNVKLIGTYTPKFCYTVGKFDWSELSPGQYERTLPYTTEVDGMYGYKGISLTFSSPDFSIESIDKIADTIGTAPAAYSLTFKASVVANISPETISKFMEKGWTIQGN